MRVRDARAGPEMLIVCAVLCVKVLVAFGLPDLMLCGILCTFHSLLHGHHLRLLVSILIFRAGRVYRRVDDEARPVEGTESIFVVDVVTTRTGKPGGELSQREIG